MYAYAYLNVPKIARVRSSECIYMYIDRHIHMQIYIFIYIHVNMNIWTYIYMYV